MSRRLIVNYQKKPCYEIVFAASFAGLGTEISSLNLCAKKVCIVTDTLVGPLYADEVRGILETLGFECLLFCFNAGEQYKNLDTVRHLYRFLIENKLTRKDVLVALGGGVVGDVCGFAAATYLRGIDYIGLPTTLLAQVDSSIGGKTGVDFDDYKNMVGAFFMPRLVYINTKTLDSLPDRQYFNGFAEVMKHGLIKSAAYYEWLLTHMDAICERSPEIVAQMIEKSCAIKKAVVEKDPHETGQRALLNFGHTLGHALETASAYKLLHGEAVALGMVCAAYISWQKGHLAMEEYYEIRDMFVAFDLPISVGNLDAKTVLSYTKSDKKVESDGLKYILLEKVGASFIDKSVTDEEMMAALETILPYSERSDAE